ncbi:MAG: hypothetical protein H7144_13790 [Burkholderiales bacterium]|nr:hypothetical protein [Phycisphaerae bacterium]
MNLADRFKPFSFGSSAGSISSSRSSGSSDANQAIDEALVVYSRPIFEVLKESPDQQLALSQLAEAVDAKGIVVDSYEHFVGLVQRLAKLRFVEILPAKFGRDQVKLIKEV